MIKKKKLRKFLYEDEVNQLAKATQMTRYPIRDEAIILLTYNHAYRASELCNLQWDQIDFARNTIRVIRQKGGKDFTHSLYSHEKELLLKLRDINKVDSPYVFITERKRQFERHGLKMLIRRLETQCDISTYFSIHHLRHAKGVFLREKGIKLEDIADYLGHRHLSSTQIYTQMAENPFFKHINEGSILSA